MPNNTDENYTNNQTVYWTADASTFSNIKFDNAQFQEFTKETVKKKKTEKKVCRQCGNYYRYFPDDEKSNPDYCSGKCVLEGKYFRSIMGPELFEEGED